MVATPNWCARFPAYKVANGDPKKSDHRHVTLVLDGCSRPWRQRQGGVRFKRFEAWWLLEENCDNIVKDAWEDGNDLNVKDKLRKVVETLNTWSREVLGDLGKRIKKLKSELEAVRREQISDSQVRREQTLSFKLERLEEQHDLV